MADHQPEAEHRKQDDLSGVELDPFFATSNHGSGGAGGDGGGPPTDDWLAGGDVTLSGPDLGGGRGLDAGLALEDFGQQVSDVQGVDQLEALKAKKVSEIDDDANLMSQWQPPQSDADEPAPVSAPVAQQAPAQQQKPKGPVPMAADRAGMRAQITKAGQTEIQELQAAFGRQVADLDTRLDGSTGKLDGEITAETAGIGVAQRDADQSLVADIGKRSGDRQAQITVGKTAQQKAGDDWTNYLDANRTQLEESVPGGTETSAQRAAAMRANGTKRAAELRAAGQREAAAARTKALQAATAALARANKVAAPEQGVITTAGTARAATVDSTEAEAQAQRILARSESAALAAIAEGERSANALVLAHPGAATSAADVHRTQRARVTQAVTDGATAMQSIAATAHGQMETERATASTAATTAGTDATGTMAAEKTAAAEKRTKLREETVKKLEATLAAEQKKIEAKTAKMLAELDKANDKDLAKVGKKLGKDLLALDQSDGAAETAMKKLVKRGDQAMQAEVEKRRKAVRAAAAKAKATIRAAVTAAKKNIAKTDAGAKKSIAAAAKQGVADVHRIGQEADTAMTTAHDERVAMSEAGKADQAALDATAKQAETDMRAEHLVVDKAWAATAKTEAEAALDGAKPIDALNVLTSLTPEGQGMAIDAMDPAKFAKLLTDVPEGRREELESLIKHTTDPERKLKLWEQFHKAELRNDVVKMKGDVGVAGSRTPAQEETFRRHERRRAVWGSSLAEIDEEMAFLRAQPGSFTAADVDAMIERKGIEHDLEMKYNLNITNKPGARPDGSKIVWTKEELAGLESSFAQVPESHVAGNPMLKELRREAHDTNADGTPDYGTGGTHGGGVITVMDGGAALEGNDYRHGGDDRQMASPYICGKCGTKITILDMVVTHEIGHDIHDQSNATFQRFQAISGWETHTKAQLSAAGLSAAEIKKLEKTRGEGYNVRNEIRKNGKIYMIDPYSGGYLAVNDTAIPEEGESVPGAAGEDKDTWGYARSNYKDHFAELYAKAVHAPTMLHKDLVDAPRVKREAADDEVRTAQELVDRLSARGATTDELHEAEQRLEAAKAVQIVTKKAEDERLAQFNLMRNDVFHTNTAQTEAAARLTAKGLTPDQITAFEAECAKASTPEQIKTIEARY